MYKFRNKKTQITAAAMALLISAGAVPSYAIEQVGESFVPYSSGRLETTSVGLEILSSEVIATGTVGTGTALWRLYSDGTVIVGGGTIQSEISDLISISPWSEYSEIVTRIIFSEPVFGYFSTVNLFQNLNRLLYIENFHYLDTTRVVHMAGMFHGASSLASLDLSSFDTSNVTNMIGMFREASSLVSLDLSSFDTSNVTNMAGMFEGASSLVSLDLSNFDTSNVTTMEVMFGRTLSLESLDLSSFNTSNVTTMTGMFYGAGSLVSLDLSSFDTSNVESMIAMFSGTTRLSYLDLTSFDTSNVRDMSAMFILSGLKRLDISSFDTRYTRVNNWWGLTNSIFFGMNNLRELVLGEKFVFRGSEGLPMVSNNEVYTGVWRNIGDGTFYNPLGEFLFTSNELMRYYDGIIMADTWVWQPREHVVEEEVEVDKEEEVEADKEEEVEADKEEEVEVDKEEEVEADKEEEVAEDKEEEKEEKEEDEYEVITPQSSNLRVLTINPHNNSNHFFARWFEEWVNGKGGSNQRLSKNINLNPLNSYGAPKITFEQVTTYELSRNPNHKKFVDIEELLRDDQGNYRFDIIAIGSWDFGGILRPGNEPHIIQAVSDFMDAGGAVIFGHDTLT
ncbi:MAG: BspA family leucine-rich repeat surface protein, partial [Defluviitaleaceae bacterium]|nr:BspA family leucine-rich repeat surface protein [Defluviitaleaceae bacterium]